MPMSFLKKTLASFGIGSAKVDSILNQDVLYPGQSVDVSIHVYGGATEQAIDNIDLKLCCRYIAEAPDDRGAREGHSMRRVPQTHVLAKWSLPYAFTIHSGEERTFDVQLDVPWNTPVTIGDAKVWLETGLDVAAALDPTDKDILTVRPDPLMDAVLSAFEAQGLRIRQVECEEVKGFDLPFVQEFEMVPTDGPYHGVWRELEFVAHRSEQELKLWFEVDRTRKGEGGMLASLLGSGKLKRELTIPATTKLDQVGELVLNYLDQTTAVHES
ncbi:sporulation control protein Spo0M [Vibrio diabolicus]|uniref:Sporulation control protein Spo0M n=2 Tax=Vibrio diabolicus TaxID=50719 RepID=A0ABM6SBA1_9VIBR|nr:sporulation control protein Spo0M [Vibrio diabolicus]MDU9595782.1 sporulation control protein Spo0M [Vibrio sp. 2-1-2a]MDU9604918.1 sporulation control protein Spo0M [Vibrio sp. 1-2-3a]MPS40939.1 sporulation control protein Spo0M [Vibrio sp. VGrn 2]NNN58646.1 sporulation control protein Spo0M [Vibrio sp. 1-2 (7-a)]NNN81874.1 sporulation control protein Spo0M [Vibrio sp. 11-4(1)]PWF68271.1 sporulation control protein Spo0M [Vibrio sp. T9]